MRLFTQQKKNIIITTLILLGIIAISNIIASGFFYRFDLTQEKEFSVSSATKKIVKNLDDIVTIRAYFSQELPTELLLLRREVEDVFGEYKNYSRGKIKVEFIDPDKDEEKKQEALNMGIPQIQFNIRTKDKFELRNGFMGAAIMYEDRKEIMPLIQSARNLEYELTAAIKKVTSKEVIKIGFLTGHGEKDLYNEMKFVGQDLERQYKLEEVNIGNGDLINNEIKTLVIAGPTEEFKERDLFVIDQFLMKGGNLLIALDSIKLNEGLTTEENKTGLEKILKKYGLEYKNHLILDAANEAVSFSQGLVSFFMNYPFWPKIAGEGLNRDNVITNKLEAVVFPWAASIEATAGEGNQLVELAKTTEKSWIAEPPYQINPQQSFAPTSEQKARAVAVMLSGKFESYFKDKAIPVKLTSEVKANEVEAKLNSADGGKIFLAGDGDFMADDFARRFPDNAVFLENIIDYLSLGEDLIGIRSRGASERGIKEVSESTKDLIKYGNIFGITALVILFGAVRFWSRRRRREY